MEGSNVESKTRCQDLAAAARRAAASGARYGGALEQVDTYFDVEDGRLKLREISHRTADGDVSVSAEVIRYVRADEAGARVSVYDRSGVSDGMATRRELEAAHGVRGVVRKRRELWILGSTRIHLDSVDGLGAFVELETVAARVPGAAERAEHDRIFHALELDGTATVGVSYIDLVRNEAD